jgi:hypothetical protein
MGATLRTDKWWVTPALQGSIFLAFSIYVTVVAFLGDNYWFNGGAEGYGGYLSPFYSPILWAFEGGQHAAGADHAWFGAAPGWLVDIWPKFLPYSPAWFILAGPLSFRLTCYYYRKFYYRSYFFSPPGCAVGGLPQKTYKGETGLLIIQNIHRYTWFIAVAYIGILSYDAWMAMWQGGKLGFGVGTLVLIINPILLGAYTFGCHACRHMAGGSKNCFSADSSDKRALSRWRWITRLNEKHQFWAWASMLWVWFTDIYIRLVCMGVIPDLNTWG